ncbi:MAG: phage terminase large subunit [Clostridia bacterium]|nr:phage terminase large subunit [Clostridia bacterium]
MSAKKQASKKKRAGFKKFTLSGSPQPRQLKFFEATQKYVAYGGARGGGKSWALRRKVVLMCLNYPGLSVLIIRRTYPELRENHIRPLKAELAGAAIFTDTRKTFEFPNGSRIKMGYCDSEADVDQYQGQEFDIIALDEATQLTEYQFQTLKGCLRGANSFPKRMYITCNPGGVGHGWVKRLFIDREYRAGEKAEDYTFIPAGIYDNKVLLKYDPDYPERLKSLPPALRDAWLYGKWDAFAGQFFGEFDMALHVTEPFFLTADHTRYCAIDYGLDMLAAVFVALSSDGRAYVYDEVYKSGMIVSEAAKLILEKSAGVYTFIAPSDLWSRQKDSGKSISELFAENGVYLTRISPERVQGWLCLKEWLKPYEENGTRNCKMKIFRNCVNLIRCLPQLLYDPKCAGDAAVHPHEITHAPDALRYFASYRAFYAGSGGDEEKHKKLTDVLKARGAKKI